jgi:outer membrane protein assembly factor BamB
MTTTANSTFTGPLGASRDSALPASTTARGVVAWSRELGPAASPGWPSTVMLWGERPVVVSFAEVAVFDTAGSKSWSHAKQGGTPVAVEGQRLFLKGRHRFIDALDRDGRVVLEQASFPGAMSPDVQVQLFWPRAHDFLAVLFEPSPQEVAEGDSPDTPRRPARNTLVKNRYETSYGDWMPTVEGNSALRPLLLPAQERMTIFVGQAIRYDMADEKEIARFAVPLDQLVDWSVDADEVYCVTGYLAGRPALLMLSADGRELWRWVGEPGSDNWAPLQPPIRLAGGRVVALTGSRVLAFDKSGRLAWQYDARGESLQHGAKASAGSFEVKEGVLLGTGALRHGSGLADGSVLVTSGKVLVHLGADGRKLFSVSLDEEILSSPAVDDHGHIYVTTASHLARID